MPIGVKFTGLDDEVVRLYVDERFTLKVVAKQIGGSPHTISSCLVRLGVSRRHRSTYFKGPGISLDGLTEAQRGYVAGFIDGEGSICLVHKRRGNVRPQVSISNTHRPTLEYLQSLIGGAFTQRLRRAINHKVQWLLAFWRTAHIAELLRVVGPHLVTKQAQATIVAQFCAEQLADHQRDQPRVLPRHVAMSREVSRLNKRWRAA